MFDYTYKMFSRNAVQYAARAMQRSARARPTAVRQPVQKRLAHSSELPLEGAQDNAFNRERRAIKAHAAATSGAWSSDGNVWTGILIFLGV